MKNCNDIDYKLFDSKVKTQRYWIRSRVKKIVKLASSCEAKLVLDIGCGTGIISQKLGNKFNNVVGLDTNKNNISQARKRVKNVIIADAHFLPFKNDSLDLIVGGEIIEHTHKFDSQS